MSAIFPYVEPAGEFSITGTNGATLFLPFETLELPEDMARWSAVMGIPVVRQDRPEVKYRHGLSENPPFVVGCTPIAPEPTGILPVCLLLAVLIRRPFRR